MRRSALTRAALVALVLPLMGFARCDTDPSWTLVWSDEFEGPSGQSPDPGRWRFDVGTGVGGWGNGQLEYDTDRPENASLDGEGHLAITARKEAFGGQGYTSARLLTQGRFARAYGRFEARMKLPRGAGLWPAFWMLGADFPEVGWPECGEIDVMEYRGQEPSRVSGALHGPGYSGGQAITGATGLTGGAGFDEDFHVFAVEWTQDWISWELDGEVWQVVMREAFTEEAPWVFDHPFFVLLNLAVGGSFVGEPDPTVFPQTLLVDYVRVYAPAD